MKYFDPKPEGSVTTFQPLTPQKRERSGQDVHLLRRIDAPGDDPRYADYGENMFPLYTVVFPDGHLWDAYPEELHGDRPGMDLCKRCDAREVNPLATSRTDSKTHICPRCEWHEATQDMDGKLSMQEEWPLPRTF